MLQAKDVMATVAVKDLKSASRFYEDTLGMKRKGNEGDEAILYSSGKASFLVYRSQHAGTNQATAATWDVGGDIEAVVETLRGKGVRFEHYDLPGMRRAGDVHVAGDMKAAWLKDPDGNILALVGE